MAVVIETLSDIHDCSVFSCGRNDLLDRFCRDRALSDHSANILRVRVAVSEEGKVVGYHALTADSIKQASLSYMVGRHEKKIPVVHLAMIAVCEHHQGGDVGAALMRDVMVSAAAAAWHVGACGLYLEAACEALVPYYEDWDFKRISTRSLAMFMHIDTLRDGLVPADNDDADVRDASTAA